MKVVYQSVLYIKIGGYRMGRAKTEDNNCNVQDKLVTLPRDYEKESYRKTLSIDECKYILRELGVIFEYICTSFISYHPVDGYCHYIVYSLNYLDRVISLKFRSSEADDKNIYGYQLCKSFVCISYGTKKDILRERMRENKYAIKDEQYVTRLMTT